MGFSSSELKKIRSYFCSQALESVQSQYSGRIEVALENGRKVLNTVNCNYSYGQLQRVFEIAFKKTQLQLDSLQMVLILGMGGGCLSRVLRDQLGYDGHITAVEKDERLLQFAMKHFPRAFERVELLQLDAVLGIREISGSYDLILVDLFIDQQVSPGVMDSEFVAQLSKKLCPGGRIYHNVMLNNPGLESLLALYRRHFPKLKVHRILSRNQMIIASI